MYVYIVYPIFYLVFLFCLCLWRAYLVFEFGIGLPTFDRVFEYAVGLPTFSWRMANYLPT